MFSFFALIILSPIFLIIIIAIKLDSKGPVLFIQKRIGIHKTHFVEYVSLPPTMSAWENYNQAFIVYKSL